MKRISTITLVILMAVLMACLMPAQVFADSLTEYISEVKVYLGSCDAAEGEGYKVLCDDNGKPVDLNQKAGGGWGSKGEKAVYLAYKTTTNPADAVTDLALMNMKGGYSTDDYDVLFDTYLKAQIIPLVEKFMVITDEFRANYNSDNAANKQRADYVYDILNKITDDDTGMKMGDLLLAETKFELGDEEYGKLTDEQKKNYGDIVTILAQANGKTTLVLENVLTRAADTNDNSWIDRFAEMTYDDLVEATGMTPTDAAKELSKLYDDDAQILLNMWDTFRENLQDLDDSETVLDELENEQSSEEELAELDSKIDDVQNDFTPEKFEETITEVFDEQKKNIDGIEKATNAIARDYLESVEYGDGTLLDFFLQEYEEVADNTEMLYPLVASLTAGQRAGLEFTTLKDMVLIAGTGGEGYSDETLDNFTGGSVYEGVDRAIYEKGGVALTSDALRTKALDKAAEEGEKEFKYRWYNYAMFALTGITAVGFLASVGYTVYNGAQYLRLNSYMNNTLTEGGANYLAKFNAMREAIRVENTHMGYSNYQLDRMAKDVISSEKSLNQGTLAGYKSSSTFGAKLSLGFGIAMVVIAGITTYLSWREMQAYYKVDFTPIPRYMVDEKDITGYNSKGEKIVIKNQSAYYKAVECNRTDSAEFHKTLGACADMNGDVGKQWLALYSVKNEASDPIIASSLKAVVNSSDIPAGYTTGIHMFGSNAAFNLNSNLYDWNNSAPSVFVYFMTDDSALSDAGSNFSGGTIAIAGGAGLVTGALATALGMASTGKKKKEA